MSSSSDSESLSNPATYLHAALRAFVSSAYDRVSSLLNNLDAFNFGPGTPYPDLKTLLKKLEEAAGYWRNHNAFIADLINLTAANAAKAAHTAKVSDEPQIAHEIFRTLTNYFFCYIKVDRRAEKPVSTVRVLFPVDFDCAVCPLQNNPHELCANSCFRFAFFPYKQVQMLDDKYNGHYLAAQFALADASFAAAAPDLTRRNKGEVPLAALMVPLLLGQPLLLADVASRQPEQYRVGYKGRVLFVQRRFTEMNDDLGIRTEAFVPIEVNKPSFMPGFGAKSPDESLSGNKTRQHWVPGFPDSCPFCIELYSPMPDWFARSWDGPSDDALSLREYTFYDPESHLPVTHDRTPIPRFCALDEDGKQRTELTAIMDQIIQILALGFNLQHYSELMAIEYVEWLREVLKRGAYDAFAPTLEKLYRQHVNKPQPELLHSEVRRMFEFIRATPRILGDVLTRGHHGGLLLLGQALASESNVDLSSIEGVRNLALHIYEKTNEQIRVDDLAYETVHNCIKPPDTLDVSSRLKSADKDAVLAPLVIEVLMNHGRPRQVKPLQYHVCLDEYQHRLSLHFCSPGTEVDLKTYLNLRQGLPQRGSGNSGESGGVGVALSRLIAEEYGFEYVIELGRNMRWRPSKSKFNVQQYRRDLHTRIYFGEHV